MNRKDRLIPRIIEIESAQPDSEGAEEALRDLIEQLRDWVEYTKGRAAECDEMADNCFGTGSVVTRTVTRLAVKAGCFRSLAVEVERLIPDLPPASPPAKPTPLRELRNRATESRERRPRCPGDGQC